jgi:hypothetical protein
MREALEDGTVRIADEQCSFTYWRPRPGVVVMRIEGKDRGQFGTAPTDELRGDVARYAPVELFVDTRDPLVSAHVGVQDHWTEWFRENRSALKSVNMLVAGNYMHFTAEVVKHFSRTGELIRVYLDDARFSEALKRAAPGFDLPKRAASSR